MITTTTSIRAIVINLKRSTDRRQAMEQQLQSLGIPFEFLEATDGSKLSDADLKKIYNEVGSRRHLKTPLTRNEIACAHSHLRVYERIIEAGFPYTLVLEDDAVLDESLPTVLNETFLSQKKFDWLQIDYVAVGFTFLNSWLKSVWHYGQRNPLFFVMATIKFPYIFICSLYEGIRERILQQSPAIVYFSRPLYLASAYIVTLEGAQKLTSFGLPIRFAADMLPNKARRFLSNFRMRAVAPKLARQNKNFVSEIGAR